MKKILLTIQQVSREQGEILYTGVQDEEYIFCIGTKDDDWCKCSTNDQHHTYVHIQGNDQYYIYIHHQYYIII